MSLLYSFLWRRDGIVLQVLVRNGIVQQGDVLRNGDTLVSRHILISQFKTGVQNFLTGSLLDRQRGIVIEYPQYGCRGESSHRGFGQASPTGPPEIQGSRELVVSEMTNNESMEMVKETTSYAREFGIGITVSCAGPDSEEYSTRNEASSCLRNVIERNPLGGMRSLGNEGAGPTDRPPSSRSTISARSTSIAPPDSTASVCPNSYRSSVSTMSILQQACVHP